MKAPAGAAGELLAVLAAKVLRGHLANRHQLLDPPPAGLANLDRAQTELLIRAMVAAARASGEMTARERKRIFRAMSALGSGEAERRFLAAALDSPLPLEELLREVRDEQTAARVYAASLLAIDRHERVNRAFLHYLAARLALPPEVVAMLYRRFGHEILRDPPAAEDSGG